MADVDEQGRQIVRNDISFGWITVRLVDEHAQPPFDEVLRLNRDLYSLDEEVRLGERITALRASRSTEDRYAHITERTRVITEILARQDPTWTEAMIRRMPPHCIWAVLDFLGQSTRSGAASPNQTGTATTPAGSAATSGTPVSARGRVKSTA